MSKDVPESSGSIVRVHDRAPKAVRITVDPDELETTCLEYASEVA